MKFKWIFLCTLIFSQLLFAKPNFDRVFSDPTIPAEVRDELCDLFKSFVDQYDRAAEREKPEIFQRFTEQLQASLDRHLGGQYSFNNAEPMTQRERNAIRIAAFSKAQIAAASNDLEAANEAAAAYNRPERAESIAFVNLPAKPTASPASPGGDLSLAQKKLTIAALRIAIRQIENEIGHSELVAMLQDSAYGPEVLEELKAQLHDAYPDTPTNDAAVAARVVLLAEQRGAPEISEKTLLSYVIKNLRARLAELKRIRDQKWSAINEWRAARARASNAAKEMQNQKRALEQTQTADRKRRERAVRQAVNEERESERRLAEVRASVDRRMRELDAAERSRRAHYYGYENPKPYQPSVFKEVTVPAAFVGAMLGLLGVTYTDSPTPIFVGAIGSAVFFTCAELLSDRR